ncbi:mitochondrial ribosomal protein L24 (uL24m) [Andalucia godoyi]|uniref:Mitochondrial ribosomal protein L24 (UL24m) n=1 Tax=Andalucia godoyi TaxID=505711 RepID=A0A8K0AJY5_ANDGO|nr:mitochondrial ribosomal protein L24 (uL24m) [Andalucia godoyi]|eukprot:ANDGO_03974.mRNA.1 mitochondrial ribosomal protein L24 (uL24m)
MSHNVWKILRGDFVQVIAGKDKGRQGTVVQVIRDANRVLIEGVNLVKKHVKGTKEQPGQIITKEMPLHVSNVAIVDPVQKVPTRVGFKFSSVDGRKVRVSKLSGVEIPRPEVLKMRLPKYARPVAASEKDTSPNTAALNTLNVAAAALPSKPE